MGVESGPLRCLTAAGYVSGQEALFAEALQGEFRSNDTAMVRGGFNF